jgi:hypothetical protein
MDNLESIAQILRDTKTDRQETLGSIQLQYEKAHLELLRVMELRDDAASEITKLDDAIEGVENWNPDGSLTNAGVQFNDTELDTCIQAVRERVDNLVGLLDGPDAGGSRDKQWLLRLKEAGDAAALLHLLMKHDVKI